MANVPFSPTTHLSSHPVCRRPTHRGAGVVPGVQMEHATVRTIWTPGTASARLCLGRRQTGWELPPHARHHLPALVYGAPSILEPERPPPEASFRGLVADRCKRGAALGRAERGEDRNCSPAGGAGRAAASRTCLKWGGSVRVEWARSKGARAEGNPMTRGARTYRPGLFVWDRPSSF